MNTAFPLLQSAWFEAQRKEPPMDITLTADPVDVLTAACALLPAEAARPILDLEPNRYETFVLAYVALRRHEVPADRELLNQLVRILFDFHDAEAAGETRPRALRLV